LGFTNKVTLACYLLLSSLVNRLSFGGVAGFSMTGSCFSSA
jgi:hypothetical protein